MADIVLNIVVKDDGTVVLNGIEKKLEEVGKKAEKTKGLMDSILSGVGVGIGLAAFQKLQGVITSVSGALPGMFNEFMRSADAMQTLSDRTGVSAEALQAWEFAAAGAGISAQQIAMGVQNMQRQISSGSKETQASIKALGLSFKDLAQAKPEKQLESVVEALAKVEDPAKKAKLAVDLLGRTGKQLVALGDDFGDLTKKAHELGIVTSSETIKAADDLGDSWGQVQMVLTGLRGNIVSFIVQSEPLHVLIEGLRDIIGQLSTYISENSDQFRQWVDAGVILAAHALVAAVPIVKAFIAVLGFLVDQVIQARFAFEALGQGAIAGYTAVKQAAEGSFSAAAQTTENYIKRLSGLTVAQEKALAENKKRFDGFQAGADKAGVALSGLARAVAEADGKQHAMKESTEETTKATAAMTEEMKKAEAAIKAYLAALPGGKEEADKIKTISAAFERLGGKGTEGQVAKIVADLNALGPAGELAATKIATSWGEAGNSMALAEGQAARLSEEYMGFVEEIIPAMAMLQGVSEESLRALAGFAPPPEMLRLPPTLDELTNKMAEFYEETVAVNAALLGISQEAYRGLTGGRVEIQEGTKATVKWSQALEDMSNVFTLLGINAESSLGKILGGFTTLGKSITEFKGNLGKMFSTKGDSASGIANLATNFMGGITTAITAAKAAIGIGKAIKGLFSKSPVEKAAETAGRELGFKVSKELAEAIAKTAKDKNLGTFEATLLHLGDAMAESGKDARTFTEQIDKLFVVTKNGSVPAAEGIAELGDAFTQVADAAKKAGTVGDAALVGMIKKSRELGLAIPEIQEFVREALSAAREGVATAFGKGGIKIGSEQDAKAQATIFSATFWASVKEEGLIASADAMKPAFDNMVESIKKAGLDPAKILGDVMGAMNLANNEQFRGAAQGAEALSQTLKGLADSGYLTADSMAAFGQQAAAAYEQAGGDERPKEALMAILPLLQSMQSAAASMGLTLDENTQELIEQAKAAGLAFPTDPAQAMLDVMVEIAKVLGADIPESAQRAASAIRAIPAPPGPVAGGPAGGQGGNFREEGYQHGGLVTSTGLQLLHGSPTMPEMVLNPRQTQEWLKGGGGTTMNLNMAIDARGANDPKEMAAASERAVQRALDYYTNAKLRSSVGRALGRKSIQTVT